MSKADFNILERFGRECDLYPETVAIESEAGSVSYGELDGQAEFVAAQLREKSCTAGDVIAAEVGDRAALIAVMLGVLRAGCVFAPLSGDAPVERLRQIAARLKPKVFLNSDSRDIALQSLARQDRHASVIPLELPRGKAATELSRRPAGGEFRRPQAAAPAQDSPAYVYFTSGSSGQPKGIAGRLNSLASRISWEIDAFGFARGTRVSQLTTPTFDPWFRDILVPLCAGGTICIPPEPPARLKPETLLEWLRDARINLMHCGPTLLNMLVSTPARIRRLPELRWVLLSGEFLHLALVQRWQRRFGKGPRLANLYGSTEATMIQFCHRVEETDLERGLIPIGRPLPGVAVRIEDEHNNDCGPGQTGEILIGGPALSLGYFQDETATREAFVARLEADGSRTIFYRTGDLGVKLDDGTFRLIGRRDDQIKIRGVRVEPREVEDALTGYPLVAACAVVPRHQQDGEPALIAYVSSESEYPPAVPEMRAYLRQRLPSELIPTTFVILKRFPLTETGKIDRGRLPEPELMAISRSHAATQPRTPMEAILAEHWAEILGLTEVGVEDHFMDLGGHSLSAMRLVSRLQSETGLELTVREVFDHPTIAALAKRIEAAMESETANRPTIQADAAPQSRSRSWEATQSFHLTTQVQQPTTDMRSTAGGSSPCNLLLLISDSNDRDSFERLGRLVTELDPAIHTAVAEDKPGWKITLPDRPALLFSPALLRNPPPTPGRICCGYPLSKSEEYAILVRSGVPVPRWVRLREGEIPDLTGFGEYVVRKPDYGAKGAEIRIVKRQRVRWKPIVTAAAGPSPVLIVQEFIYTGPWPVSYRVNTLFGEALYCMRITGNPSRPPLRGPNDFAARGSGNTVSIVANARDSIAEYCDDVAIIRFGENAARAFPDLPLLGVDILREAGTGKLFVTEVNSLGHNWNFTAEFREAFRIDMELQFDGVRKAARILAAQTRRLACCEPIGTFRPEHHRFYEYPA